IWASTLSNHAPHDEPAMLRWVPAWTTLTAKSGRIRSHLSQGFRVSRGSGSGKTIAKQNIARGQDVEKKANQTMIAAPPTGPRRSRSAPLRPVRLENVEKHCIMKSSSHAALS